MKDKQKRCFVIALMVTPILCIATLLAWSANDASFPMASWLAQAKLGLLKIESNGPHMVDIINPPLKWNI